MRDGDGALQDVQVHALILGDDGVMSETEVDDHDAHVHITHHNVGRGEVAVNEPTVVQCSNRLPHLRPHCPHVVVAHAGADQILERAPCHILHIYCGLLRVHVVQRGRDDPELARAHDAARLHVKPAPRELGVQRGMAVGFREALLHHGLALQKLHAEHARFSTLANHVCITPQSRDEVYLHLHRSLRRLRRPNVATIARGGLLSLCHMPLMARCFLLGRRSRAPGLNRRTPRLCTRASQ
mmetsp:Transcript_18680/g.46419  ORF Transcript_18680/g.46419 Transcript_18680/m.46419 type:complete len:240 (+) Transcript_18680:227-946(+)